MHAMRFEDFTDFELNVKGVSVRGLKGGDGSPLLLLHGSAHSPRIWQAVAGRLAERHAVVVAAIDFDILRAPHPSRAGQGANAPRHAYNEDPRAGHSDGAAAAVARHTRCGHREIAAEQLAVMEALGHAQFMVCGHLDGARVAQRLALDHSGCVDRMMVLDTAPTLPLDPASVPDPDDAVGDPNGWVPSRVVDAEQSRAWRENRVSGSRALGRSRRVDGEPARQLAQGRSRHIGPCARMCAVGPRARARHAARRDVEVFRHARVLNAAHAAGACCARACASDDGGGCRLARVECVARHAHANHRRSPRGVAFRESPDVGPQGAA